MNNKNKLSLDVYAEMLSRFSDDFLSISKNGVADQYTYKISGREESGKIARSARIAAFKKMSESGFNKVAFDTRRIDQEHSRNPRANLQYWNRSQAFIDEEDQGKIDIFSKLLPPLEEIKKSFGAQPEYFDSYSRILYDAVNRALRVKEADMDIFRPQLAYLEQLLFARYRLSMDEISKMSQLALKDCILKKDENLLKRGAFLYATQNEGQQTQVIKDGNGVMRDNIVNAIFGNNGFRRDGERTVERTITITIRDQVLE
ncbi:MAG TPA: hypothetical protein VM577_14095 [Anaerovoracaceae bacterium]|nr:hypothetical protein [Anaerovoracaceae bacterium]